MKNACRSDGFCKLRSTSCIIARKFPYRSSIVVPSQINKTFLLLFYQKKKMERGFTQNPKGEALTSKQFTWVEQNSQWRSVQKQLLIDYLDLKLLFGLETCFIWIHFCKINLPILLFYVLCKVNLKLRITKLKIGISSSKMVAISIKRPAYFYGNNVRLRNFRRVIEPTRKQ